MSDFFLHNFWLKMASLILATLIWLTVQANLDKENRGVYPGRVLSDDMDKRVVTQKRLELPVTVLMDGTNSTEYRSVPTNVAVTVSGESMRINSLSDQDFLAYIETGGVSSPQGEIFPVSVNLPANVTLLRVIPPLVRLKQASRP